MFIYCWAHCTAIDTCTLDCQSPTEESNSYYAAATLLILVTLHGKHIQGSPFNVNLIDNGDNGSVSGPGAGSPAAVTNLPTSLGRKDRSPPPRPSSSIAGEESVSASVSSPRPPSPPAGYQTVSSTDSSPQQPPPPPPPATVTVPGVRLSASVSQRLPPSKPSRAAPVTPAAVAPVAPPQASPPPPVQPIQQQQTLAPALDIPPEQYAAMSRLEKARYNAMRAAQSKQQQQQGQGLSQNQIYGDNSSISSSTNTVKLQRLQRHTQELTQPAPVATHPRTGTGTGGSKLSNMIRQQKNLNQSQQQAQQGAGTDMALVLQGLQAGLHGSYSATSTDVATPPNTKPAVSKSDEQKLWSLCNSALRTSKELHALLAHTYTSVREAFGDYCDHKVAPVPVLRLAEAEGARGAYKLFEDFGVTPTYLSRKELRLIFTLALASQKNHRASALTQYMQSSTGVQDSMGGLLDWTHYLVLLVLVSSYSLSKTNAFNSLYPTIEVRS